MDEDQRAMRGKPIVAGGGSHDVVNPQRETDRASPIYGMRY